MNLKPLAVIAALTLAAWSAARAEQAKPAAPYPLDTCIVSGETLGEMGKPVELEYQGQQLLFCCKSCIKKFNKNPEKYLAELAEAAKAKAAPKTDEGK